MALWDLLRNFGNNGGGMAAASNAGASSSGGGGFASLLSALGKNNQGANAGNSSGGNNLFSSLMGALKNSQDGGEGGENNEAPQLPSIQLGDDGNIDEEKSAQADLETQQRGKPLTLSDRLFGRTLTKDIQTVNPETGEATLKTVTNYKPGFLTDLNAGMNENYNNDFSVNNWNNRIGTDGRPKGAAYRIGEGLGSIAKGLATWGGDAWTAGYNGLDAGLQRQAIRTGDQLYRKQLKDNYGYTDADLNNIKGFISRNDFNTLANSMYKSQLGDYRNRKLDQNTYLKMKQYYDKQLENGMLSPAQYQENVGLLNQQYMNSEIQTMEAGQVQESNKTRNTNSQIEYRSERLKQIDKSLELIEKRIAQSGANSAARIGLEQQKLKLKQAQADEIKKLKTEKGADLAEFMQIYSGKDKGAAEYARNSYIKKYGEDPLKKLELN